MTIANTAGNNINLDAAAVTVIGLAVALRFPGTGYGLPFWLVNDEATLITGALRMLELRNPIPSMNPGPMSVLYYPPGLPWAYLIIWAPILIVQWVASGFPSIANFGDRLVSDLTPVWLAARLLSATLSVGTVVVVMRLAAAGLRNRTAGIAASLLLATSFHHGLTGHFARSWIPMVFLFWWGLWAAWRIYVDGRQRDYVWAALATGLGFAVNYIGVLVSLSVVMAHLMRHRRIVFDRAIVIHASIVVFFIFLIAAASWPNFVRFAGYSALGQAIPGAADRGAQAQIEFVAQYYLATLWRSDALFATIGILGLPILIRRAPAFATILGATLLPYAIILLTGYAHEDRYILPITPVFGIAASALIGTGLNWSRHITAIIIAIIVVIQATALLRLEYLMLQPDTRIEARRWINDNVPAAEGVISAIRPVLFEQSLRAIALENDLAANQISFLQRRRLAGADVVSGGGGRKIDAIDLRQIGPDALHSLGGERLVARLLAEGYRWYVVDELAGRGIDAEFEHLMTGRLRLVRAILPGPPNVLGPVFNLTDQFERGHGLNVFRISQLGPGVRIYRIE